MKPVNRTEMKRYLGNFSEGELVDQILDLWATLPQVRDYFQAKVRPGDDDGVRKKYRSVVQNEFFPARGMGKMRLAVACKAVMDYKKVAASPAGVADLMLFYVETGVRFTNTYGDIDEAFYLSMERMYDAALTWIVKHGLAAEFAARCEAVVDETRDIGWGFHDALCDAFSEHFDAPTD